MAAERTRAPGKITPEIETIILTQTGLGWSSRRVSEHLRRKHGVELSHVAIGKFLAKTRTERSTAAKVVVREALASRLTADVDVLTRRLGELDEIAKTCREGGNFNDYFKAVEAERKALELSARLSGADEPEAPNEDPRAAERVLARVAEALAKRVEGERRYAALAAALDAPKTDDTPKPGGS